MSAVESSEYGVLNTPMGRAGISADPFVVCDGRLRIVDRYRTRSAAEYAAGLLNADAASVDCHAVLGCKVVER